MLNFEAAASHAIVVRATDRAGLFFDQTFTISVRDINEAPIAYAESYYTFQLTKLDLTSLDGVLDNDYDDDGDVLTAQLISGVEHGTLVLQGDGSLEYDPVDVFTGTVTFTYRVTDGVAFSNSVTVTIDVLPTVNPGGGGSGNGGGDGTGPGDNTGGTGNGTDPGSLLFHLDLVAVQITPLQPQRRQALTSRSQRAPRLPLTRIKILQTSRVASASAAL